jgi:hypothetical protein
MRSTARRFRPKASFDESVASLMKAPLAAKKETNGQI